VAKVKTEDQSDYKNLHYSRLRVEASLKLVFWFFLEEKYQFTSIQHDCLETSWFEVSIKWKKWIFGVGENYAIGKYEFWWKKKILDPPLKTPESPRFWIWTNSPCHTSNFSYINFSNIAAKLLRKALKPELRVEAAKRDVSGIKFNPWADGKPVRKYPTL
jgi:F-type H+-transporting ATPase subunit epsilon